MKRRSANGAALAVSFLAGALVGTYAPSLTEQLTAPFIHAASVRESEKVAGVLLEKRKVRRSKGASTTAS
jgi:hypothetical protein